MNDTYLLTALIVPAFLWAVVQVIWYWPRLPERMATGFNARFEPGGWVKKRYFVLIYAATMIFGAVLVFRDPVGLPSIYYFAALFQLIIEFHLDPEPARMKRRFWLLTAVFVVLMFVMVGIVCFLPHFHPPY